jgi:hypothetical protein
MNTEDLENEISHLQAQRDRQYEELTRTISEIDVLISEKRIQLQQLKEQNNG